VQFYTCGQKVLLGLGVGGQLGSIDHHSSYHCGTTPLETNKIQLDSLLPNAHPDLPSTVWQHLLLWISWLRRWTH